MTTRATGRCLCDAVRYEMRAPLRDILICHCEECRRWGGYLGAFSATRAEHLVVIEEAALRWVESPGERPARAPWLLRSTGGRRRFRATTRAKRRLGRPSPSQRRSRNLSLPREVDPASLRWS